MNDNAINIFEANDFILKSERHILPLEFTCTKENVVTNIRLDVGIDAYYFSGEIVSKNNPNTAFVSSPCSLSVSAANLLPLVQTWKFFSGLYNEFLNP